MLTDVDLENMRRYAAMASLSRDDTFTLIEECRRLTAERAQVAAVLTTLPHSWGAVRAALNELQRLLG